MNSSGGVGEKTHDSLVSSCMKIWIWSRKSLDMSQQKSVLERMKFWSLKHELLDVDAEQERKLARTRKQKNFEMNL